MSDPLADAARYLESWPQRDRQLWTPVFTQKIRAYERDEELRYWKPQSIKVYTIAYTKGLDWLRQNTSRELETCPESRWNEQLLDFFVRDLEAGHGFAQAYSETSIQMILVGMERVLSRIAPSPDRSYLRELAKRFRTTGDPTDKIERLNNVSSQELLKCGEQLMARAREDGGRWSPLRFRTGLQIAFLAFRPLRLADFALLKLGTNLVQQGSTFRLVGSSQKTDKPFDVLVPARLYKSIEEYLSEWRPRILKGRCEETAFWVSWKGGRQGMSSIYKQITKATYECDFIGVPIYPHLFRDCLATSIAKSDPENWIVAHQLLGNTDATVQRNYEHGGAEEAAKLLSRLVES